MLEDQSNIVFYIFLSTITLLLLGGLLSILSVLALSRLATESGVVLGNKLLDGYIHQSWEKYSKKSSSTMINEIYQESSRITQNILVPLLMINKNILLTTFIILGLLFVDPILTMLFFIFLCITYVLIYFNLRGRLYNNSENLTSAHEMRLSYLNDIFSLFRQIKIWNVEEKFQHGFDSESSKWGRVYRQNLNIALLPRYFVEVVILIGCSGAIFYSFNSNEDFSSFIPTFSVFAFSAFKLLPAIQSIYYSVSQIRGNIFSLEAVLETLKNFQPKDLKFIPYQDRIQNIEFRNVSFEYDSKSFELQPMNFRLDSHGLIGITGHSGAGKSTFLDILLGLTKQSGGEIYLNNMTEEIFNNRAWFEKISYFPPKTFFINDNLETNIFMSKPSGIRYKEIEEFANLDFLEEGSLIKNFKTDNFSEGQIQRIGLARAYAKYGAELYIFDEPTSSLDNFNRNLVLKNLLDLSQNNFVFVVTHDLEMLQKCNNIFIFENGSLENYSDFQDALDSSNELNRLLNAKLQKK